MLRGVAEFNGTTYLDAARVPRFLFTAEPRDQWSDREATVAVGNSWYASHLGAKEVEQQGVRAVWALLRLAGPDEQVVVHARQPGLPMLLAYDALRHRRRMVLLEFIRTRPRGWRRVSDALLGCLLRRSGALLHVLTAEEGQLYRRRYGLTNDQLLHVPWPLAAPKHARLVSPPARRSGTVVASGRAACDWRTLFAAARIGEWEHLVVICGRNDEAEVKSLNAVGAEVLVEVPAIDHDKQVASAAVYALVLREDNISSGHIRLMTAIAVGTPVVASEVAGLSGYLRDGVTARAVPPGDPLALARAVSQLLAAPADALALAGQATRATGGMTFENYFAELRRHVHT